MKKRITLLSLVLAIVVLTTSVLFACNADVNGKYYLYDGATKFDDAWIEIDGNSWTSSDGMSGKVELDGEKITLSNDSGETLSGTIKDGIITLGDGAFTMVYAKDGKEASNLEIYEADKIL